jgi:thiol:disulfide interchange protein DsbD
MEEFKKRGVTKLRGDWTDGNPEITAALREHDRDGVPLYILYPGKGEAPRVLPQVLTPGLVLDELSKIK